jgi:redox-sensitive bicupin YhaK (pirin superfamily)
MTSGRGIAHAEQTPRRNSGRLNGAQLWVALPDVHRHVDPSFDGIEQVPVIETSGGIAQVFAGSLAHVTSPGRHFSELVGADVQIHPGSSISMDLRPDFEHAVLVLDGDCTDRRRAAATAHALLWHRSNQRIVLESPGGRALLIGGPPFTERILMVELVARTPKRSRSIGKTGSCADALATCHRTVGTGWPHPNCAHRASQRTQLSGAP